MINHQKLWLKNIIIKCILGIIILSLIVSTISHYLLNNTKKYVVQVNGEKISFNTLQKMYIIERKKQKKMLGNNFSKISQNEYFIEETYKYVLSQLINNILLEQYAKKLKLNIEDKEIKNIILSSPMFQDNGIFNKKKYFHYLLLNGLQNNEYIQTIKRRLITENLINDISNTNFLLDYEKKNIIKLLSEKRIIQKVIINIEQIIQKQKITNQEIKTYFSKYRNHFYTPEQFKISYIKLDKNHLKIKYHESEVQQWYKDHITDYLNEEKKKYSIIQVKTKEKALQILSQLTKNKNFQIIAKEQSTDPISSIRGGDIGWISKSFIPEEIEKSHLYKVGQISKILPFKKEFLIVKLDNIQKSQKKSLSEVHNEIIKKIINQNSQKIYFKTKHKIFNIIEKYPNRFDILLQKIHIHPQETNWFTKKSIPKEFNQSIIKNIIFNKTLLKKENQLLLHSGLITLKNHTSFIISIKNYKKKKIKTFQNAKKDIIYILKKLKTKKNLSKKIEKILMNIKRGKTYLLKKYNISFNSPQIISRYDKENITPIVFSLPHPTKNKKIYTIFQDKNRNIIILFLSKIYQDHITSDEETIMTKYLEKNHTEIIFHSILKNLYENSNIIYDNI